MEHALWSEAELLPRESLSILGEGDSGRLCGGSTATAGSAGCCWNCGGNDEAERLILAGYGGMKAREAGLPAAGKSPLSSGIAEAHREALQVLGEGPENATVWKQKLDLSGPARRCLRPRANKSAVSGLAGKRYSWIAGLSSARRVEWERGGLLAESPPRTRKPP